MSDDARGSAPRIGMGRIAGLDGLRAFAIALVLAAHATDERFAGGGIGVAVFFVLSGYLITSLLTAEHERTGSVRLGRFYARRALRLWPALIAMLAVTVAVGASIRAAAVAGLYLTDLASVAGGNVTPYGHTWSLAVEEQFYLLWPLCLFVVWRLRDRMRTWFVLGTAALSVLGCAWWTARSVAATGGVGPGIFNPLWQGHGLLIGCWLALAGRAWTVRRPHAVAWIATAGVLALAAAGSFLVDLHLAALWNLSTEVLTVLLVLAVRTVGVAPFTWPVSVWMGQRSYAIYLWHLPLIVLLTSNGVRGGVIAGVVLAFVAAELSARFVEAPFLRLKDRLHAPTSGVDRVGQVPFGQATAGQAPAGHAGQVPPSQATAGPVPVALEVSD